MKKLSQNPFERLHDDFTPIDFAKCAFVALEQLVPFMEMNNQQHVDYYRYCGAYADMIEACPHDLDDLVPEEEWRAIINMQILMRKTFTKIWNKILLREASALAVRYLNSQSEKASKRRKISEKQEQRIAQVYWNNKANGTFRGTVKQLAGDLGVSRTTIKEIADRHRPQEN